MMLSQLTVIGKERRGEGKEEEKKNRKNVKGGGGELRAGGRKDD